MGVDSENIDNFLDALNRLKRAKEYFLATNQGNFFYAYCITGC